MAQKIFPPLPEFTGPGQIIVGALSGAPTVLPSGTPGEVLTVQGDGTLAWDPSAGGGGGGVWGSITGTLSNQTDLQTALDGKSAVGHNHDGSYSLLGHTHTQAQSHGSPDTDTATTALHHTLGSGANQAAAGNHAHANDHVPATVLDSASIDMGITGQQITASAIFGTTATTVAAGNHSHANDHVAATVADTASIDMSITGQQISAAAIFGTTATTIAQGNHTHAGVYALSSHTHAVADIQAAAGDVSTAANAKVVKAPTSAGAASFATLSLDELNNVDLTGAADTNYLQRVSGVWVPAAAPGASFPNVDANDVLTVTGAAVFDFGPGFTVTSEAGPEARIVPNFGTGSTQIAAGNHDHLATHYSKTEADARFARLLYIKTSAPAGDTYSNSAAVTTFASQYTVPTAILNVVGRVIRVQASGTFNTHTTGPTLRLEIRLGGVNMVDSGARTMAASIVTRRWFIEGNIVVWTTGVSGTVMPQGDAGFYTAGTTLLPADTAVTATVTRDTTVDQLLTIVSTFGTANANNNIILRELIVEML